MQKEKDENAKEETPTKITVHCPSCGSHGKVDSSFHGKLRCPACRTVFEVKWSEIKQKKALGG